MGSNACSARYHLFYMEPLCPLNLSFLIWTMGFIIPASELVILGFLCGDSTEVVLHKQTLRTPLQRKFHKEGPKPGQELMWPHIQPHLLDWVLAHGV